MSAYYNEIDPFAAAWLRELIKENLIADGEVDERSIELVQPGDLRGFTQCHFFAGIGGWGYALRLAGWPDDRDVWTGSCPCQPFSSAGKGEGFNDPRHLWPAWFRVIRECRPDTLFGEQVASPDGLAWFDTVATDLESEDYAVGQTDLPAASLKAVIKRQRLWFVGVAKSASARVWRLAELTRAAGNNDKDAHVGRCREVSAMGSANGAGLEARGPIEEGEDGWFTGRTPEPTSATGGPWRNAEWVYCTDDKYRAVEPGTFPLAHGVSARVGRLRGYGNAIVPQIAQVFIESYLDCERHA